jgi:protein-S-isoprenylcysteine O-methyltransferase Ste14
MKDRPGVIAPPPLFFAAAFLGGWLTRNWLPGFESKVAGVVLTVIAFAIGAAAAVEMFRAHTNIDPYKPSTSLVTGGPFRFSRNPLYVAMAILYCGVALFFGIPAALAWLPVALAALYFGVIRREERYLERKFGDAYRGYRGRVGRWV